MSTIGVSKETKRELKRLKKVFKVKSYDELLKILIKDVKIENMENAWEDLQLEEDEAEQMRKILQEKRETWWKKSS